MSLKKSFSADGKICTVTFNVNPTAAAGATKITLVGEFNGWDKEAAPMKKAADGSFSVKEKSMVPDVTSASSTITRTLSPRPYTLPECSPTMR